MSRIVPIAGAVACLIVASQAQGATRNFPVGGFDRIRTEIPFDVHVHDGAVASVRAEGPDTAIDRLVVETVAGQLVIRSRSRTIWSGWNPRRERAIIDVTVPALRAATLAGPGDLTIDRVRGRAFSATLNGPGNLAMPSIEAERIDLVLNGPGDMNLAGRAATAAITLRGPGDVHARGLTVRDAVLSLSGPGSIALTATGSARGSLSGPGDIAIAGGARCAISKHGPGDVTCR